MAFEQNQQLQRLLDPLALQQMAYDQERQYRRSNPLSMPQPQQQQMNQSPYNMLQQAPGFQVMPLNHNNNQGWLSRLGSGIKNFFIGSQPQSITSTPYDQQQHAFFQQLLNSGLQNMQNPYEGFEPLQQHLQNYFEQQILPNIAERFSSLGNNRLSSPSFAQQLQGGIKGLAENLLAHKMQYGQQNRNFGLQQAQLGLTPRYQNTYMPGQPGLLQNALPVAGNVLGAQYFGGNQ